MSSILISGRCSQQTTTPSTNQISSSYCKKGSAYMAISCGGDQLINELRWQQGWVQDPEAYLGPITTSACPISALQLSLLDHEQKKMALQTLCPALPSFLPTCGWRDVGEVASKYAKSLGCRASSMMPLKPFGSWHHFFSSWQE